MQKQICICNYNLSTWFLNYTSTKNYVFYLVDTNNVDYPYLSFIQNIIQNLLNLSLTLVKWLIGYAQKVVSLIDFQTTKYCINELTKLMNAYTSNYFTHGTLETLTKLYCLNVTKQ